MHILLVLHRTRKAHACVPLCYLGTFTVCRTFTRGPAKRSNNSMCCCRTTSRVYRSRAVDSAALPSEPPNEASVSSRSVARHSC
jgi:hypothetical protein